VVFKEAAVIAGLSISIRIKWLARDPKPFGVFGDRNPAIAPFRVIVLSSLPVIGRSNTGPSMV
jgi:hypothetical protein